MGSPVKTDAKRGGIGLLIVIVIAGLIVSIKGRPEDRVELPPVPTNASDNEEIITLSVVF
jgi:hypothetical protein